MFERLAGKVAPLVLEIDASGLNGPRTGADQDSWN